MLKPLIPDNTKLNDITWRATFLGCLLSAVMGASTTYLALRLGITVSASVPSVAFCVALFRVLRASNALEVNYIQTIASAGYVVGSVAAFILPGLIMVGAWKDFHYWWTFLPLVIGGIFGVYLSVPLRSYYFTNLKLRYPEGVAVAALIKGSIHEQQKGKKGTGLLFGTVFGAILQFFQGGLRIIPETMSYWKAVAGVPVGLTIGVTPSLIGVGYIIGLHQSMVCFGATLLSILVGVPVLGGMAGVKISALNVEASMMGIWAKHVRFVGIGVMLAGGLCLCLSLLKPILLSVQSSIRAAKEENKETVRRTEQDIRMKWVIISYAVFVVLVSLVVFLPFPDVRANLVYGIVPTLIIISAASFIISAISASIGGYMAGAVGSSYNPLSGVSIINISLFSMLMSFLVDVSALYSQPSLVAFVLFLITFAGGACSISCDSIQDLKAGQILGATPWKQQVGLIIGVIAGALVVPFVLQLLFEAYGIGNYHPGCVGPVDPTKTLQAPKAVLLSSLVQAIFNGSLDWKQIYIGFVFGLILHVINIFIKKKGYREIGLLSGGVGIYLPPEITTPLFFGGLLFFFAKRKSAEAENRFVLPSGLVAGEALIGVLVAGLLMSGSGFSALRGQWALPSCMGDFVNLSIFVAMGIMLYNYGTSRFYPKR